MAADFKTIRTGSDNCWPYWIEGGAIVVGAKADGTELKADRFVWLTTEGMKCGEDTNGVDITGWDNCKVASEVKCNSSKLGRLNITSDSEQICIGAITFK